MSRINRLLALPRLSVLRNTLVTGSGITLLARLLASLSGLVLTAMLTRMLSRAEIGEYFILVSAASIGAMTIGCGLNLSVVRLVAESQALKKSELTKGVILSAFITLAGSGSVLALLLMSHRGERLVQHYLGQTVVPSLAGILLVWTLALALQTLLAELFRGMQMILRASVFGGLLASAIALLLLATLPVLASPTLTLVLATIALGVLLSAALAAALLWKLMRSLVGFPEMQWRRLVTTSLPLWITNLMLLVLMQADLWILHSRGDSTQVALYGAATRLTQLLTLPLLVLNAALMPVITTRHTLGERAGLQRMLRGAAALASAPALLAIALLVGLGGPVLHLFYGTGYEAARPLLLILSAGQLINILCGSAGYTLMMTGHQKDMMCYTAAAGVVMVGLGLVLVKPFGATGVAFAAALSLALQSLAMWLRVKIALGIWTHPSPRLLVRPLEAMRALQ